MRVLPGLRFTRRTTSRDGGTTGLGVWLCRELRSGGVMIDVGANVGEYSALAADIVGRRGHVYAFEPAPDNVASLCERFRSRSNVTVVEAAVSDRAGTSTFFLDRARSTRHSLAPANVGKAGRSVVVTQVTLDDYCDRLSRLDVVKIDAQGAESHIIRGARRLLTTFRPTIVLELWPRGLESFGASADTVLAALRVCGYSVYRLSAKGSLKPERFVEEFLRSSGGPQSINVIASWPQPARAARGTWLNAWRAFSPATRFFKS
jgi:FkbM family methyltransferase